MDNRALQDGDPEEYDIVGEFGMQQMDQYGFDGSRFFTKLELGTHVTSLGDEVFSERAPWMTSITLPSTLSSIGMWAFEMCNRISSVTIPSSVQHIGQEAFNATLLNNITFQGKTLAQVQEMENYPWGIEDTSIINVA